ncbi:MAG TPA: beta-L-arabinofuranosidase domain-containing protein [Pirellulales bacterium]|jgi:hypothetical protein|nr:beta-L-arabinofuranosidase domain-containing protein [Pirellulales bacterium]
MKMRVIKWPASALLAAGMLLAGWAIARQVFMEQAAQAQDGGGRNRNGLPPLIDPNTDLVNLAPVAVPSTSFASGDQTILAINDGVNPRRSSEHYGNWPQGGTQWVEYTWPKPISTNKADVYWYVDGRGLHLPKASRLKYFDGEKYIDVPGAKGLGVEAETWNETTFDEITTNKIRLEFEAAGGRDISTGITEFRVFDSGKSPQFPPMVKAGPDRVVMLGGKTYLRGGIKQIAHNSDEAAAEKITWSKASGPGEVTFEDAANPMTTATFSTLGDYTLKLSASLAGGDDLTSSDTLHVQVLPPASAPHLEPVYTLPYKVNSPLWSDRLKTLIANWIPHCCLEISDLDLPQGGIANLIEAGKKLRGEPAKLHVGYPFSNAWVYNTLEAMCLAQMVDAQGDEQISQAQEAMRDKIEEWIPIILAAQEPDGYLQTRFTLGTPQDRGNPPEHWSSRGRSEHEGYVAGYFLEAAISHYNMTGGKDRRLYDAAKKLADCWCDNIGPAPKKAWYDGHQEMEQALVRFARMVDHVEGVGKGDKYTQLARFLIDSRRGGTQYDQSHLPAVQQYEAVGHAVRAGYFYSGMADIAMMTHDIDYQSAVCSICDNIVNKKYYLTGGIGSGETAEGFGGNYSLPNNAYCESCSGTAELFFQYKMNLTYQDAKYADLFEETLYNAILGDIDLEGKNFYYDNPLETAGTPVPRDPQRLQGFRVPWHACPCCVSNISRTLLLLPTWMYATGPDSIYVNLFAGTTVDVGPVAGTDVQLVQATNYPWDGKVTIVVNPHEEKEFSIHIRSPQREISELYTCTPECDGITSLAVNGKKILSPDMQNGYAVITRQWQPGDKIEFVLPMKAQRVKASQRIAADRGRVALRYGPLIYNFEAADNHGMGNNNLPTLKADAALRTEWQPHFLDGVVVIKTKSAEGGNLLAIPNYVRNNRGGHSAVWIRDGAVDETAQQ